MAQTHNALSRGPFGRALKDALGDSKAEGALERYGETMQPIINLWGLPEWAFLRGETLWACSIVRAADAANVSIVGVMLPVASKFILMVDRISGRNSVAAGNLILSMLDRPTIAALAGFALGNPPFFRDQRAHSVVGAQFAPLETFSAASGAVAVNGTMENISYPTSDNREFVAPPLIVRPGGGVLVQSAAINQQIVVSFVGRIRNALPTELKS